MTRRAALRAGWGAVLAAALAVRLVWPLADPAERLSWSNGVITDPAAVTHAARNAVLFGEWIRDSSRDLVFYPLLNAVTWAAYRVFGVSRLVTQVLAALFGAGTVIAVGWSVRRGRGDGAGLLAAAALATSFWITMFSRVPVAENLVALLLALACVAATGRSAASAAAAGAIAGTAAFFGKAYGVAFAPALLVFLALRERRARAALPAAAGLAAVAAVWIVLIGVPFRAAVLDQLQRAAPPASALGPAAVFEQVLGTVRASWLFHRMPVLGALGGLFVVGTLLDGVRRRRRLDDGTALLALWLVAAWALLTLLPYRAPRYYVLAAVPLAACGACRLHEIARGTATPPVSAAVRSVWIVLSSVVAVDVAVHLIGLTEDRLLAATDPGAVALRLRLGRIAEWLRPPGVHAAVAALLAAAGIAAALRPPAAWARAVHAVIPAAPTRRAAVLGGAALLWQSAQLVDWAARRAWAIEETKASLDAMVGEDAVLLGAFAPVLVQDSRRVGIPLFGHAAPGELDRYGVTHVVFGSEEDAAALARVEPEAARRLTLVREWPFRSRHARVLQLYRLRGAAYRPTELEIAAAALRDDEPDAALAALERYRAAGGRPVPDVPSMEAHAHFLAGRLGPARAALERAVAMRPTNPEDWFNLGMLRYRAGDADGARRAWRRSLALDPWDERPVRELRRIGG